MVLAGQKFESNQVGSKYNQEYFIIQIRKEKEKEQGSKTFEEETAAGLKSFAYNAR